MSERGLIHLCKRSCSLLFWFTLSLFCEHRITFHWPNALHFTLHAFICADLLSVKSYFPWGNMNQTRPLWVSTGLGISFSHPIYSRRAETSVCLTDERYNYIAPYRTTVKHFNCKMRTLTDVTQFPGQRVTYSAARSIQFTLGFFFLWVMWFVRW